MLTVPTWCEMLSRVRIFATPWTAAHQAPLSMGFSIKNTGVSCHFLLQGIFPTQEWNQSLCVSCTAGGFFTAEPLGKKYLIKAQ